MFDPTTIQWYKVMERKNLFFVGLAFFDIETRAFRRELGFDLTHFLFKNEKSVWSTYRSQEEYDRLYKHISEIIKNDPTKLERLAQKGIEANTKAKERMASNVPINADTFAADYDLYCDSLLYGVTIPWSVIGTFETLSPKENAGYETTLKAFESFRAVSIYPDFEKEILEKYRALIKTNISQELLRLLTPWELKTAVTGGTIPDQTLLEQRDTYCIHWSNPDTGKIEWAFNKEMEEKLPILKAEIIEETKEIRGTTAYKGKVEGKVRIIHEAADCGSFIEGEILVSPSTNPSLMPAILKCSAIITDEGGMTCHAAIIARELKKPAVIGTRIATKVLSDGDTVKVNADKGIISIITQQ